MTGHMCSCVTATQTVRPSLFAPDLKHGSFLGKVWPGVSEVTCDSIGPRVSWQMLTFGHFFVQQYTVFQKIERSALNALGGTTFDLANGPIDVLNIDGYEARVNADSYAWFVTELAVETGKVISIIYLSPCTSIKCVE